MACEDIPNDQWKEFCEHFTRRHHGWLVDVYEADRTLLENDPERAISKAYRIAHSQVLDGLTLEVSDHARDIYVRVGRGRDEVVHGVRGAQRLCIERTPEGEELGLRIDDGNDSATWVHFRVGAAPETLDGLAETEI